MVIQVSFQSRRNEPEIMLVMGVEECLGIMEYFH